MAHHLIKLGKEALQPQKVNGVWHKAVISAKNIARLRKEALLSGSEWTFDEPPKPPTQQGKPKGHKWQRTQAERAARVEKSLEGMDEKIAAHREARRNKIHDLPLIDRILLTPKQRRAKLKG